jgi:thioredoxin reductase (NADPH)
MAENKKQIPAEQVPEIYDVIIIGGGPSGSSAALYTARADLKTLVIDKGLTAGALGMSSKISNFPGVPGPVPGEELLQTMRRQAEAFGARFLADKVIGTNLNASPKEVMTNTDAYRSRALILATGAMGRSQTIPGESKLIGRGVSYCALCDGAFFRNQPVAVVGFNDEAVEEALRLTTFASRVYLLAPGSTLRASQSLADEVQRHPKMEIQFSTQAKEIVGQEKVEGVRIQRSGKEELLPVEGVFVFLQGNLPVTDFLLGQLESMENGCLLVDRNMQTNLPGVFAIGDLLCTHVKQAVIAAADGVVAAIAVEKYIKGRENIRTDWK